MRANLWLIGCGLVLTACGEVASDDRGAADSGAVGDTRLFVPDIPSTYGGELAEPDIEVLAFTLREDDVFGEQYLVAFRSTSVDRELCAIDVTTRFFDSGGASVALAQGSVETPIARAASGGLTNCLGPGQLGMQAAPLELMDGARLSDITSARWELAATERTDVVASTELEVTNVAAVPTGFGGYEYTGQLQNRTSSSVNDPSVSIFGVNAVGRPLFESSDVELTTIAPSSAWTFQTTPSFDEPHAGFVAFLEAHDE